MGYNIGMKIEKNPSSIKLTLGGEIYRGLRSDAHQDKIPLSARQAASELLKVFIQSGKLRDQIFQETRSN